MSGLDKKLKEILNDEYVAGSQDTDLELYGLNDACIGEIRDAFIDDGWRKTKYANYTNMTDAQRFENSLMTGREWYSKLDRQLDKYSWTEDEKDSILQAAFEVSKGRG